MFLPTFVDHLVFRVREMARSELFYTAVLEEPFCEDGYVMYQVGETRLFFTPCADKAAPHDKEDVGFNHIALGVRTPEELQAVAAQLDEARVVHSGIKLWQDGLTRYVWLDDPDGIRVEYWLRIAEE